MIYINNLILFHIFIFNDKILSKYHKELVRLYKLYLLFDKFNYIIYLIYIYIHLHNK